MNNEILKESILTIIKENPQFVVQPNYEDLLFKQITKNNLFKESNITIDKLQLVKILKELDKERCCESYTYSSLEINESVKTQIQHLQNIPQPVQRTAEWYLFRNEHITASNAWKAFGTQASQNQLIYEKCKSYASKSVELSSAIPTNELNINEVTTNEMNINETKIITLPIQNNLSETSLTWGHKYEPLTRMLYESMNQTLIQDFGCIAHPTLHFLAASPDGIVVGDNNYGRMIEIKNVVSREINGIPKLEYYIQTQMQMEVCDLDECDFVETKFKEFDSYHEYINNITDKKKGIIVVYVQNGEYVYYYMPFNIVLEEEINQWLDNNMTHQGEWIKNVYWTLEVYSCVLIKRQKEWFNYAIPILQNIWYTICAERLGDFSSRAPKKRNNK